MRNAYILVRLYPFVYMDIIGGKIALYDTVNKRLMTLIVDKNFRFINKTSFFIDNSPSNQQIAKKVRDGRFGVIDVVKHKIRVLSDFSSNLSLTCKKSLSPKNYKNSFSINLIKNLYISLYSSVDVFSGYHRATTEKIISNSAISNILENIHELSGLCTIGIFANKRVLKIYKKSINSLSQFGGVSVFIPFDDFSKDFPHFLKKVKIKYVIYKPTDENLQRMNDLCTNDKNMCAVVYLHSLNDYELYIEFATNSNIKFIPRICPFSYNDKLSNLLEYTEKDIISSQSTINDCIRKEWINPFYFGDLYISSDGSVMLNPERTIGNVVKWDNIEFESLLSKRSLWRYTRRNYMEKCKNCLKRDLCPPLSQIEWTNNITFCTIR